MTSRDLSNGLRCVRHCIKCPYCIGPDIKDEAEIYDQDAMTAEFECKHCGTRFAVYVESLPDMRKAAEEE